MELLCRIEMFGQLKLIHVDQEQTRFRTHKMGWILAYLALHLHQSTPRERLLDLFWPEMDLTSGRDNLNNALSSLRRQLEPAGFTRNSVLIADRQFVQLNPQAVRTDVQEFEELLRTPLLECAIGLYRGELLPGCYEDWAGPERQRLHDLYVGTLDRWSKALEAEGDFAEALTVLQRAVKADAYREEFYQRQIRLHVTLGQPAAALESYQKMERLFEAELGVAPSARTRELVQQLQRDPRAVALALPAIKQEPPAPAQTAPDKLPSPDAAPLLPLPLTRFFGRADEQAQLAQMLQDTDTRLVTLVGPGGAGKTRMAVEIARRLAPDFSGRVWWVSLADLPDARLLSSALTRALKVPSGDAAEDPLAPVFALLNAAPCLLVLDNFEHLLWEEGHTAKGDQAQLDVATALVRLLLERAPRLRCLVTSRRALRLSGEQEFPLLPLPLPTVSALPEEVLTAPSVSLYTDRARLARPDFAVTAHNAEAVAQLCRKLEGIPLAIEMAAAWAKVLPPAKMLERLEERLDTLTSRRRDLPTRHQSLRATIDWSYDLLDAPQQRLLTCLSVFRGGWTLEAAEAICPDEPPFEVLDLLTSLVEKSLVVSEEDATGDARYRLLETVRQYSRDRLNESGESARTLARHYSYFMKMAEASWDKIRGSEQVACLDQLEREHDNLRAALAWARTGEGRQHSPDAELNLSGRLRPFWDMRGYWREGRERLEAALRDDPNPQPTEIRSRALIGAGVLASNRGDIPAARTFYEACLTIRRQLGDLLGIGNVTMGLGAIAREDGDFTAAHHWYAESLAVARSLNNRWLLGAVLGHLGILAEREDDQAARQHYYEEALQLHRAIGDLLGIAIAQQNLGNVFAHTGNLPAAYASLEESLTLLQQVGDKNTTAVALSLLAHLERLHGRGERAVFFLGASQRIQEEIGVHPTARFQAYLLEAQKELGEEAFAPALARGRALPMEQAVEDAITIIQQARKETEDPTRKT